MTRWVGLAVGGGERPLGVLGGTPKRVPEGLVMGCWRCWGCGGEEVASSGLDALGKGVPP